MNLSFFCACYAPDLVGALTGIRVNSARRWHHWFPRRYSQEGRARVDPGFVNADAILPHPMNEQSTKEMSTGRVEFWVRAEDQRRLCRVNVCWKSFRVEGGHQRTCDSQKSSLMMEESE